MCVAVLILDACVELLCAHAQSESELLLLPLLLELLGDDDELDDELELDRRFLRCLRCLRRSW